MAAEIVFVAVDGSAVEADALAAAKTLADLINGEARAVFVGADDAAMYVVAADGLNALGPAAAAALQEERTAARDRAEQAARAAGVRFEDPGGVRAQASALARLAAFAVVDAGSARGEGPMSDVFDSLLLEDGAPVFVPRSPERPRRVAVAWDGSREAARALKASAPLLALAEDIVVLSALWGVDMRDEACAEPALACDWLARRGLTGRIGAVGKEGDLGATLLAAAARERCDLLVAGAYGHARLREAVFGGVTRSLLRADETAPSLLLAH